VTFVITQACIDVKDMSCIEVCPVDCIYTDEVDRICYVHPVECIDCAACEAACPVAAIFEEEKLPAESGAFTAINALYFTDRAKARDQVDAAAEGDLIVS
jgi:NAD-dependent dihydropyrimidine dehydrogenase PreA subunit